VVLAVVTGAACWAVDVEGLAALSASTDSGWQ
jgi:hypothetical protein